MLLQQLKVSKVVKFAEVKDIFRTVLWAAYGWFQLSTKSIKHCGWPSGVNPKTAGTTTDRVMSELIGSIKQSRYVSLCRLQITLNRRLQHFYPPNEWPQIRKFILDYCLSVAKAKQWKVQGEMGLVKPRCYWMAGKYDLRYDRILSEIKAGVPREEDLWQVLIYAGLLSELGHSIDHIELVYVGCCKVIRLDLIQLRLSRHISQPNDRFVEHHLMT